MSKIMQQKQFNKVSKQDNKHDTLGKDQKASQIADSRFAHMYKDPRFQLIPKQVKKTKIDKRFSNMFTDKRFKIVAKTDKYGRQLEVEDGVNKELDQFYYKSSEDDEAQEQIEEKSSKDDEHESGQKKEEKQEEKEKKEENNEKEKKQKKEKNDEKEKNKEEKEHEDENDSSPRDPFEGGFKWDEVSSSDEEIPFEMEQDDLDLWEEEFGELKGQKIRDEATKRLALQNYDWTHITASDILLMLNSFKPSTGVIKRVSVYPSEIGKKKMEFEELYGPQDIYKSKENPTDIKSEGVQQQQQEMAEGKPEQKNDSNDNENNKAKDEEQNKKKKNQPYRKLDNTLVVGNHDEENTDIDLNKLRKYEKERLKYFYAIIECDSRETADNIYQTVNDKEFEMSNIKIDLRFVPDDLQFPYEPKEVCDKIAAFNQQKNFINRSTGHTKVTLSWDEPNFDRFQFLQKKNMTQEELDKIDLDQIVANDDEQESEDHADSDIGEQKDIVIEDKDDEMEVENNRQKKRKNRENKNAESEDKQQQKQQQQQQQQHNWRDEFNKKKKKTDNEYEMVITFDQGFNELGNKILNKQKEEKQQKGQTPWEQYIKKKKEIKRIKKESFKQKKNGEDDYFLEFNEDEKREQVKKELQQLKKEKDELSLLVDDKEKKKEFKIDVEDPRFRAIYNNSNYSIDPTHKSFKQDSSGKILSEQIRIRKKQKLNEDHKFDQQ